MRVVHLLSTCVFTMLFSLIGCSSSGDNNDNNNGDMSTPKSWGAPVLIENGNSDYSTYPRIGMTADGSAIAVWFQNDENRFNIWANQFDGSVWKDSEPINSANGRVAEKPRIAVAGGGKAISIWEQSDGTRTRIWANRFDGNLWGTPEVIDVNADSHSSDAQIAITPDGSAIAVWTQFDGSRYNIWANRFDGNTWCTAERIGRNDLGNSDLPQVAMAIDGSAIAVWFQADGPIYSIWASRFDGRAWGAPQLIENNDIEGAGYPHIAVSADGSAIAVWQQSVESRNNVWAIWANRFDGSAWGAPERIDCIDANDANFFGVFPRIALADNGSAIAVWKQSDGIHDHCCPK